MQHIYLDNNATTQIAPEVVEAMVSELHSPPANPSSIHSFGQKAKATLLKAKTTIASYCKASPAEIFFTSGGTEAMHTLIHGLAPADSHILSSNTEHACIEQALLYLQKEEKNTVTFLPSTLQGAPSMASIEQNITPQTKLLVFTAVNGETGVKLDLQALADLALKYGIPLVVDGIALLGKEPLSIPKGVTAMGFSGHKLHGPKGIGCVYLRSKTKLRPTFLGGGQEYGLRSGTENLPGIVGLAKAVELLSQVLPTASTHMNRLRTKLEEGIKSFFPIQIHGAAPRICNVSNMAFPGIDAETLLIQLDRYGVAASHGSACSSGALEPSRILINMGVPPSLARSSIRFSLCRYNTAEEIDTVLHLLSQLLPKLKPTEK